MASVWTSQRIDLNIECEQCVFYTQATYSTGVCHRYPPTYNGEERNSDEVHAQDWCGEFRREGEPKSA